MALTKNDIYQNIQEQIGFTRSKAVEITESLIEIIKHPLGSGESLLVSGFGKFEVKEKNKRRGRNPATEEEMMLRARRVVTFRCSGKLRKMINGK